MPDNKIIELLQIYIGCKKAPDTPLTNGQWEAALQDARRQSLLGVVNSVIQGLPLEMCPPRKERVQAALAAEAIAAKNTLMNGHCRQIVEQMRAMGLECCILKGQGFANLYPQPEDRCPGDIDLWVRGTMKDTLSALRSKWKVGAVFYHHTGIHPFDDRTEVEVHFKPSWMNNPFTNRKLQNYFDSQTSAQFDAGAADSGFPVPDNGFNCVFCTVHIYRHLLSEGVGLRQVMDLYFVLKNSSAWERTAASGVLRNLKMTRFTRALMFVLREWFCLDEEFLLMESNREYGRFLMNEILMAGNFGQFDTRYSISDNESIVKRASKKMARLSRFMALAPTEVLWAPVFKTWQHVWRKFLP